MGLVLMANINNVLTYLLEFGGFKETSSSLKARLRRISLSSILLLSFSGNALAQVFEEFYVPLPEDQAFEFFDDIDSGGGVGGISVLPVITRTDIVIRELGTVVIFDQNADGYEADDTYTVGPFAATTQFWGDSDCSNGFNPNLASCTVDTEDVFGVGEVVVFDQTEVVARDYFRANQTVNITRSLFPTGTGTFLAGAFELFPAAQFGNEYILPIGENTPDSLGMFEEVALTIMASEDNTSVIFDPDGDGPTAPLPQVILNRGDSIEYGNGPGVEGSGLVISEGATISSGAPVQVNVLTGEVGSTFQVRFYTLFPNALLSNINYEAVGTTDAADAAVVFLFNPNDTDIIVDAFTNVDPLVAATSINIAANSSARFEVPTATANGLTGIRFESQGEEVFTAYTVIDDGDQIHDWGHVTTPLRLLGDTIRVGFAPGNNPELDNALDPLNASPIWVIADVPGVGATQDIEICVDAAGDGGPLTDATSGNTFDFSVIVQPLDSTRLYSQGVVQADNGLDQTGMLAFACNSVGATGIADPAQVLLASAWGQDPEFTAPGDSGFDVGTTIRTGSSDRLFLGDEIFEDLNGNGTRDAGEPLIPGVDVTLTVDNITIDVDRDAPGIQNSITIRTTSNGYLFTGLSSGQNYTVTVSPPDGFDPIADPDGVLDNTTIVNLSASTLAQDFGYENNVPVGQVGDFIYSDTNGNGIQEPGELGIGGINVELCRTDGPGFGATILATDEFDIVAYNNNSAQWASDWIEADDDGSPATTLPGNQGIFITGAGELSIRGNAAGPSLTRQIDLTGFVDAALTFGFRGADDTYEAGDQVFVEVSVDGGPFTILTTILGTDIDNFSGNFTLPFDSLGSNNVQIRFRVNPGNFFGGGENLFINNLAVVNDPLCQTEVTDVNGAYLFESVPTGSFEITVLNPPAGLANTDDPGGQGDSVNQFDLLDTGGNLEQDFGYFTPGSVIGHVYIDLNGNGVQEPGEPNVEGLNIEVTDANGALSIVTTDANGDYIASVPPGFTQVDLDRNDPLVTIAGFPDGPFPNDFIQTDGEDPTIVTAIAGATVDAGDDGFFQGNVIGDTIYSEEDGTPGVQGAGDPGIPNVQVTLTPPPSVDLGAGAGVAISQFTDANGNYSFSGLLDGTYEVTVTQPSGTTQTEDPDGGDDNTSTVTIAGGVTNNDQDFGYDNDVAAGLIGDRVYSDLNGNGTQDVGEPGLPNIMVQLCGDLDDNNATVDTCRVEITDADGDYLFGDGFLADGVTPDGADLGVPASDGAEVFTVTILNPPVGQTNSQDPDGGLPNFSQLSLGTAGGNLDQDFGYFQSGTVTGHLYIDSNGNGTQDLDEPNLIGVDVVITDSAGNIQTITSDLNGDYSAEVPVGDVTVNVDETDPQFPLNHLQTEGDDPTNVTLLVAGGTVDAGIDGYAPAGFIGDLIFFDANGAGTTGLFDPGIDTGAPGVLVTLTPPAGIDLGSGLGVAITTLTDANGNYGFGSLQPGNYTVSVTPPSGVNQTVDPSEPGIQCVVCDNTSVIILAAGETNDTQDFGYQSALPLGQIGDAVFTDANGNGLFDANESGIAGINVQLCGDLDDNDGTPETCRVETTNANGGYLFGDGFLADGVTADPSDTGLPGTTGTEDYTVTILNPPAGAANTADPDGLTPSVAQLTLPSGISNTDQDFGYVVLSSIAGSVWLDEDLDGILDIEETGITGVQVRLIREGVVVATTVADANGDYGFPDVVPGEYTVDVVDGSGTPLENLQNTAGPNGIDPRPLTVPPGTEIEDVDFGYIPNTNTGAIGDRVWFDADQDGIQDPGEAGIEGVILNLLDSTGATVATATTNANGDYLFTDVAFAEDYVVSIPTGQLVLDGFTPTVGPQSEGGFVGNPVNLTATSSVITDIDFGFQAAGSNTIVDSFWVDSDRDGLRDLDEEPIANVSVTLFNDVNNDGIADDADGDGQPDVVATTLSDENGQVSFTGLVDGSYVIGVTDINNELNNFVGTTGEASAALSDTVALTGGETNTQNSFGYTQAGLIAGTVYADTDSNSDQDAGEAGFSGTTVTLLLDADNNGSFETTVESVLTGPDGSYAFNVNLAGDFRVVVTPPGGTQTEDPEGAVNNEADITLILGESSVGNDFGYTGVANTFSMSGTVFIDPDKNGIEDAGEPGIVGVTLALIDRNDVTGYDVIDGMLDLSDDGRITAADDGTVNGVVIIDGMFDTDGSGVIDESDNGVVGPYSVLAGMVNIAQGGVANQSSTGFEGDADPNVAIDGNPSGGTPVGTVGPFIHTLGTIDTDYWEVDLGSVTQLSELTIFNRDNAGSDARLENVRVFVADTPFPADPTDFTGAAANADVTFQILATDLADPVIDLADISARFIRLQKSGTDNVTNFLHIAEIKVTPSLIRSSSDAVVSTITTDALGNYTFSGLPNGDYAVAVTDDDIVLAGFDITSGLDVLERTINNADETDVDFGYIREENTASIAGEVFLDENNSDSAQDEEFDLSNVNVYLCRAPIDTGITVPNGVLSFARYEADGSPAQFNTTNDILSGTLTTSVNETASTFGILTDDIPNPVNDFGYIHTGFINIVEAGDYTFSTRSDDGTVLLLDGVEVVSNDFLQGPTTRFSAPITLTTGFHSLEVRFFERGGGQAFEVQYETPSSTGFIDIPPAALSSFIVTDRCVPGRPSFVASTTTDVNGEYIFRDLPPDQYVVDSEQDDISQGIDQTLDPAVVSVAEGEDVTDVDHGYQPSPIPADPNGDNAGVLSGFVWVDVDANGNFDANEAPIAGVTINVFSAFLTGPLFTTTTRADGSWIISNILPPNLRDDLIVTYQAVDDGPINGIDSAAGFDLNELQPTNFPLGDDNYNPVLLLSDDDNNISNLDFGFDPGTTNLGSIRGSIYTDADQNGDLDASVPSIDTELRDVTVNLLNAAGDVIATTVTDANGEYMFIGLDVGDAVTGVDYQVVITDNINVTNDLNPLETLPLLINLRDVAGTSTNPTAGVRNVEEQDAGFISDTEFLSIGNRFFFDTNGNGISDDNEPGIEGVTVQCWLDVDQSEDADNANVASNLVVPERGVDNLIRTVTTDANGEYVCTSLPEGQYIVVVADANGFDETEDGTLVTGNAGDNFAKNWSYALTLNDTTPNFAADFGVSGSNSLSGTIFVEAEDLVEPLDGAVVIGPGDLDGVAGGNPDTTFGSPPPGDLDAIVNIPVDLLFEEADGSFSVIQTVTTDANGDYSFAGLPDGRYQVRVRPTGTGIDGFGQTGDPDLDLVDVNPTDLVCDSATASICDNMAGTLVDSGTGDILAIELNPGNSAVTGVNFGYQRGFATTPVTMNYFSATRTGGVVTFAWETSSEVGHAGFQVYARVDEGWELLNEDLLVGSLDGKSDFEARQYVFQAQTDAKWFALVDVSTTEDVLARGPFQVGEEYGAELGERESFDWSLVEADSVQSLSEIQEMVEDKLRQRADEAEESDPEFEAFLDEVDEQDGE